jgi:hypothetical protein
MSDTIPDSVEAQIDRLRAGVRATRASVEVLSTRQFLGPLGGWTPRDVVAHLIGWNRYSIRGARQLLEGELPFYDADPGEDYGNVNARLVAEYPSRDRAEMLVELERSAAELEEFLSSLSMEQWRGETGVVFEGEELTIRRNVELLIEDHHHHSEQLRSLAEGQNGAS